MKNIPKFILSQWEEALTLKQRIASDEWLLAEVQKACELCRDTYLHGGKILIAGNGGSAADAQHMAGELVSRFYFDRPPLNALALTTDSSVITAIGNDYGYDQTFARQVNGLGNKGDVFVAISTSGRSKNILMALKEAHKKGINSIGLTGESGGEMGADCDVLLKVPSSSTPRIQEIHIFFIHTICGFIEEELFSKSPSSTKLKLL